MELEDIKDFSDVVIGQATPLPTEAPPSSTMEGLLKSLIETVNGLREDNATLRKEQAILREQLEQRPLVAEGVQHTSDPNTPLVGDARYARRVTLVTRPVNDNPQDYPNQVSTNNLRLPS